MSQPGAQTQVAHGYSVQRQIHAAFAPIRRVHGFGRDEQEPVRGHLPALQKPVLDPARSGGHEHDRPHNEARRAALSNLGAIMGRAAVHSGRIITWEEAMASDFRFCANVDELDANSPAPVQADAQGRYPAPSPGQTVEI